MERRQGVFYWVLASAAMMLVGAFGPWVKVFGMSANGTDGSNDGWLIVAFAVIAAAIFVVKRGRQWAGIVALIGGIAATATAIYERVHITNAIKGGGEFADLAQIGWGLNLCLAASISFALAGFVWWRTGKSRSDVLSTTVGDASRS